MNALSSSDGVIIPVQTQKFSLDGLKLFLPVFEQVRTNINPKLKLEGILITMSDNTNMSKAVEDELSNQFGKLIFNAKIHRSVEAANSTFEHKSLVVTKNSKLGKEYENLANELLERTVY